MLDFCKGIDSEVHDSWHPKLLNLDVQLGRSLKPMKLLGLTAFEDLVSLCKSPRSKSLSEHLRETTTDNMDLISLSPEAMQSHSLGYAKAVGQQLPRERQRAVNGAPSGARSANTHGVHVAQPSTNIPLRSLKPFAFAAPFSSFLLWRCVSRRRGLAARRSTRQAPPRPPKEEPTPFPSEPIFPPAAFHLLELFYEDPESEEMVDALEDFQDLHETDRVVAMDLKNPSVRRNAKTGDRIKRLLDPLILPTVDEFPRLTCGQALHALWPAGSEGTILQPLYQRAKALPGTSSPLFFFIPFVATHVVTCMIYLALDWCRPAWVQAMMAHDRRAGDWGGQDLGLARTLWSQIGVAPVTVLIVCYMLARNGPVPYTKPWVESCFDNCTWELPATAPSLAEFVVHLTFCLVVSDAAYGYVWYSFYTLISLEAHTGWRQTPVGWIMNLLTLGNFGGSMHHHLHHAVVWGNYAPFLSWMDKLIGTEILLEDEVREPEFSGKAVKRDRPKVISMKSAKSEAAKEVQIDLKGLKGKELATKETVLDCEASQAMKAKGLRRTGDDFQNMLLIAGVALTTKANSKFFKVMLPSSHWEEPAGSSRAGEGGDLSHRLAELRNQLQNSALYRPSKRQSRDERHERRERHERERRRPDRHHSFDAFGDRHRRDFGRGHSTGNGVPPRAHGSRRHRSRRSESEWHHREGRHSRRRKPAFTLQEISDMARAGETGSSRSSRRDGWRWESSWQNKDNNLPALERRARWSRSQRHLPSRSRSQRRYQKQDDEETEAYLLPGLSSYRGQLMLKKAAKERGLSGYDLIDAMDVWYGSNSPDFKGPYNQLDFIGNRDGRVTVDDWQAAGLPTDHFHYFDTNGDGFMSVDEAHSWHQQRKPARTMNLSEVDNPPVGHLKPMGSWKAPLSSEGLEYRKPYPHPREFWRKHMDGYLPANLKGAQHGWPSMNWTREELVKRFGWVDAKLEPKDRGWESHHFNHTFLQTKANLWIATGYTRSQFHYDKEWNVNCLLSGTKRWIFLDPFKYDSDLQWSRGRKFKPRDPLNNAWTDWVYLDPDRVDLIVQHKLRNMDYYELIQEAGDCIFIPYAMLHQVQKLDDGMQVAASWMFLPESIYEEEVCKEAPLQEDLPLAAMDTLFMYSGRGLIPQGYQDPLNFVTKLSRYMAQSKEEYLSLETFTKAVTEGDAILKSIRNGKKKIKNLYQRISAYGTDRSEAGQVWLSRKELRRVPLRLWAKAAAEGDDEGPLLLCLQGITGQQEGQEYEDCSDEEFKKMTDFVRARLETAGHEEEPTSAEPDDRRGYGYGYGRGQEPAEAQAAESQVEGNQEQDQLDEQLEEELEELDEFLEEELEEEEELELDELEDELAEDLSDGPEQHKEERRLLQERLKQAQQELENFRQQEMQEGEVEVLGSGQSMSPTPMEEIPDFSVDEDDEVDADGEDAEDGEGGPVDEVGDEVAHVDPYELADSDDGELFAALEKAAQESGDAQESLEVEEAAGSQESPEAVEAEPAPERAAPDLGKGEGRTKVQEDRGMWRRFRRPG
eukprot:s1917_g2.t1